MRGNTTPQESGAFCERKTALLIEGANTRLERGRKLSKEKGLEKTRLLKASYGY